MVGAPRTARRQGGRAVRPVARLALVAAAVGCASASVPPGGPEDFDPPTIQRVRPDTNAVNVRDGAVTFSFNEVVSERPQGSGTLAGLFLISPSWGEHSVSWRRTTVSVRPRGGLRPNTTYTVRMLPGLTDLENNVDSAGATVVFSTGATIAQGNMRGIVFDWLAEKPAPQAMVEAFPLPTPRDSVRYLTLADSVGRFDLAHVPPGRYLLRASVDQNRNRLVDARELYDTMSVTLVDSLRREVLAFVHDTIGAGIQTVTLVDSLTLRVLMDRPLDTALVIDTTRFSLRARAEGGDSITVPIVRALSRQQDEQRKADSVRTKAVEDSIRRAVREDSLRAADSARAAAAPAPPPVTRRAPPPRRVAAAPPPTAARDTATREPPPKPSVPAPVTELLLTLASPLDPQTSYRLRAVEMRTLLGYARTSERVFTTPRRRPTADSAARDTSRATRDSTRARTDTTARDPLARDTLRRDTLARDTLAPDMTRLTWTPGAVARRAAHHPLRQPHPPRWSWFLPSRRLT